MEQTTRDRFPRNASEIAVRCSPCGHENLQQQKNPMMLVAIILLICLRVTSYTRRSRFIGANFDDGELEIDLVTIHTQDSIERLCANKRCDVQSTLDTIESWFDLQTFGAVEDAFTALNNHYSHIQSPERFGDWRIDSIDQNVLQNHYAVQQESKALIVGGLQPRDTCTGFNMDGSKCTFARYVASYRLRSPVILQGPIPFNSYVYLFELADDLFNAQLYDHAEAWCSFLIHNLLPPLDTISEDNTFSLALLESNILILLIRGSMVLSEIARLKGQLDLATHHSMRVIRCYQLLSARQNVPNFDLRHNVALISRLRILLTIPPTPPDYATAEKYRQQMIEDLTVFLEDVKKHNETISLDDLSSHISAMPFNMAHQGLNDAPLQHILHTVLTTICPELVYTSPYLVNNADGRSNNDMNIPTENNNMDDTSNSHSEQHENNVHTNHKVIKVGFISTNFFDHSIGRILVQLFIHLQEQVLVQDNTTFSLDVYVLTIDRRLPYSTIIHINATNIASPTIYYNTSQVTTHHDTITRFLSEHFKNKSIRLPDNIHTIRAVLDFMKLDILVFTDVGMDFSTYQLAFGRFAPYQAAWWGHPITPSLPSIDYFITLIDEIPTADAHYGEQVIRMEYINTVPLSAASSTRLSKVTSGFYSKYSMSNNTNHLVDLSAHDKEARGDVNTLLSLGFPMNCDMVVVLGRLFKLHPAFDELLVTLLFDLYTRDQSGSNASAATATYIVLVAESVYELNTIILERLITAIDTRLSNADTPSNITATALVRKYIRLVGYNHYYTVLRNAKVVLDTNPYGGCLTSHDALSHHVPIVTLPSDYIRGRFTLGMYRNMNMSSLVAKDSAEFNTIVLKLLSDEVYWLQHAVKIRDKFAKLVTTNNEKVAQEWAEFFVRILSK